MKICCLNSKFFLPTIHAVGILALLINEDKGYQCFIYKMACRPWSVNILAILKREASRDTCASLGIINDTVWSKLRLFETEWYSIFSLLIAIPKWKVAGTSSFHKLVIGICSWFEWKSEPFVKYSKWLRFCDIAIDRVNLSCLYWPVFFVNSCYPFCWAWFAVWSSEHSTM